jgi:apolipoprotein N-acyltransferase
VRPADRIAALSGRAQGALALAAGGALTLAQPPYGVWPLLFAAWPALLMLIEAAPRPARAARLGWLAGFGFFLTGLYWIGSAFLIEASKVWWYAPVMPLAVGLLAAVLAGFWAAAFWAARRFWPAGWPRAVALALAFGLAEMARGSVLTGFPWALQSHVWVDTPVMQAASLIGAHALGALTVAAAAAPAAAGRAGAGVAAAAVAAAWLWGADRLASAPSDPGDGPVIRLVQPNVPQGDKWSAERTRIIFSNLLDLTAAPAAETPALVVWPEVAVTFLYQDSPEAQAMAAAALPPGAALAVGSVRRDDAGRLYNSLLFYGPDGAEVAAYDKAHLTPFGEYVPYVWLLGALGIGTLGDGLSGFTPGTPSGPVALPGLPPAAPLICYEIVFPAGVAAAVQGARWILQATNDAWFGDSGGPRQHLAKARIRAIEQGLPVARAANTGVSAMIDPYGRVMASLPLGARGALDSRLPPPAPETLFSTLGPNTPLALLAFVGAAILLVAARTGRPPQG